MLISGDNQHVTKQVADSIGITRYMSELSPKEKLDSIQTLQNKGKTVCMIGD